MTKELTRQLTLFAMSPKKRRKLMHCIDAGMGMAKFECKSCGYISEWLQVETLSEAMRGRPCPNCNPAAD